MLDGSAQPSRLQTALSTAAIFGVAAAVWAPFLFGERVINAFGDWSAHARYTRYAVDAVFDRHAWPLWVTSPDYEQFRVKGVHSFFANPETTVLSVVTLLTPALGFLRAVKVQLTVFLLLGAYGCLKLARELAPDAPQVRGLLLGTLLLANGAFTAQVLVGQLPFMTAAAFPLVLAWVLAAARAPGLRPRVRLAAQGGALLGVFYFAGNTHLLVHLLMLLGLHALVASAFEPATARGRFESVAVTGLAFGATAAFKLLPGLRDFGGYKADYYIRFESLAELGEHLLQPMHGWMGHEKTMYVGWVGVALLALGFTRPSRRTLPFLLCGALFAYLGLVGGDDAVRKLPLLDTQGVFSRFRLVAILCFACAGSIAAADWLELAARAKTVWLHRGALVVAAAAALIVAWDVGMQQVEVLQQHLARERITLPTEPVLRAPALVSSGSQDCQIELAQAGVNDFRYRYACQTAGPHAFVLPDVKTTAFWPHLAARGAALTDAGGRLGVQVDGAAGEVALAFSDGRVWLGLAITVLATCGLGWLILIDRRRG